MLFDDKSNLIIFNEKVHKYDLLFDGWWKKKKKGKKNKTTIGSQHNENMEVN